jgi:hypothetical protein
MSETINSTSSGLGGFFSYVFNFDEENKATIMNMLQYTILSIIPVLLILKITKHIIPEEDESKGSLEIFLESVSQVIIIMLAIWFTNKIINYIPTYSGEKYHAFNEISFIIPFMVILATMQTKLGAKFNILIERTVNLYKGEDKKAVAPPTTNNNGGGVRVTQPISMPPQHQPSQSDYLDRNQLLPSNLQLTAMPPQQAPDFNQMYQNQATPMPGAAMPGMIQEPMAANEAFGGGFSTW